MAATSSGAEPNTAAPNIKKARQRSSAYPSHTIAACLAFTKKIDGHFSNVSFTPQDVISKALKQAGGTFLMLLSSSAQYGLLDKSSGEGYKPSAHFKKIDKPLPDENVGELTLECFGKPPLYRKLITQYKDKQIPSEIGLANTLERNYSIFGPASELAAKVFFINANALKLIGEDQIFRVELDLAAIGGDAEGEDASVDVKPKRADKPAAAKHTTANSKPLVFTPPPHTPPAAKTKEIPIFLKDNREAKLVLPPDFDDEDIRKTVKVLTAYLA